MNSDMNTKFFTSTLALASFSFLLMGCGPQLTNDGNKNDEGTSSYYLSQTNEGNYRCPTSANITPSDPRGLDGTPYTGCGATDSATKVKIKGQSPDERNICVFPVQFLNETQFIYKLDRLNQPLFSCYDSWSQPVAELDFPYINFNGAIVVDYSLRYEMSSCLALGQNCPTHSIGRIR